MIILVIRCNFHFSGHIRIALQLFTTSSFYYNSGSSAKPVFLGMIKNIFFSETISLTTISAKNISVNKNLSEFGSFFNSKGSSFVGVSAYAFIWRKIKVFHRFVIQQIQSFVLSKDKMQPKVLLYFIHKSVVKPKIVGTTYSMTSKLLVFKGPNFVGCT